MNILSCNRDSWSFILVQNFSVLHEKCATNTLDFKRIFLSTEFIDQKFILFIELIVGTDEKLISAVMNFMSVEGCLFLGSIEERHDVSKLGEVQQCEGELLHLKRNTTYR